MKIKEVTYSLAWTIPHPAKEYSSFKPMMSATAELEEGESASEALEKLSEVVKTKLNQHIRAVYTKLEDKS